MGKIKYPETVEKLDLIWQRDCGYYALADRGEFIKIYRWDGVSVSWNEVIAYEKFEQEDEDQVQYSPSPSFSPTLSNSPSPSFEDEENKYTINQFLRMAEKMDEEFDYDNSNGIYNFFRDLKMRNYKGFLSGDDE